MSNTQPQEPEQRRRRTGIMLAGFAAAMLGLSFVAAPAYRAFCKATGYAGTTKTATVAPVKQIDREMVVRFDANVASDLPWRFAPEVTKLRLHVGEVGTIVYTAENLSDHETRAIASFNVSPGQAGAYFNKLACFCFQEQRLGPHEKAELTVVFFLDPALEEEFMMKGVEEVTLSYTFFAVKNAGAQSASAPAATKPELN
jgi:cytochrome c oxidase assembly protein subunit 11